MQEQIERKGPGWQIWALAVVAGVAAAATVVALRRRPRTLDVDAIIDACDRAAETLEEALYAPKARRAS